MIFTISDNRDDWKKNPQVIELSVLVSGVCVLLRIWKWMLLRKKQVRLRSLLVTRHAPINPTEIGTFVVMMVVIVLPDRAGLIKKKGSMSKYSFDAGRQLLNQNNWFPTSMLLIYLIDSAIFCWRFSSFLDL